MSTAPPVTGEFEQRLVAIARDSAWFMAALHAVRELGLPSWCIGAGAVRTLAWDALHGFTAASALPDVDVAYFDADALDPPHERALERRLAAQLPGVPWEVVDQAAVHRWFEQAFGHRVPPLRSLHEAVASWPETATCVGLTLHADDSIGVIAPHGLDDLFRLVVRHNPVRASRDAYRRRLVAKRYAERWPRVRVIDAPADSGFTAPLDSG